MSTNVEEKSSCSSDSSLFRKQLFPNSCGACSLLVAAKELGVEKMPVLSGLYSELNGGALELTNECESDLYRITSGSTSYRSQSSNLMDAGYSMPQGIITACRLLGIDCEVTENNQVFSTLLSWFYPEVKNQCEGMGCPVRNENQSDVGQLKLKAMAVSIVGIPAGLHWVVSRPDGSYMDPAIGKNADNFFHLDKNAKSEYAFVGYYDTGISIILKKPNSDFK
ncbi:hypothetical protein ACRFOT_004911 [Salmonella enterica]